MTLLRFFPECVRRWWPACLVLVAAALTAVPARAQFDLEVEQTLLMDLFRDGKYKQAISESRRLEKLVKPAKKNTPPSPATKLYIELLIYRGTIERRMGSLDDADRTLTEAFKQFTDPAFQQYIIWSTPAQNPARNAYVKMVEMSYLNLLDNGTEVTLEKIRKANQRRQVKSTQPASAQTTDDTATAEPDDNEQVEQREQIEQWFRKVDDLVRRSQAARSSLLSKVSDKEKAKAKVDDEDAAVEDSGGDSPQTLMMMSMSRPYRYFGMRYLEASKLPWTLPFDSDAVAPEEPAPGRKPATEAPSEPIEESADERLQQAASQRLRAAAYLQRSTDIAETAMAPALGGLTAKRVQAATEDDPEPATAAPIAPALVAANQEAARIRAERLVPMAEVSLLEGDLAKARSLVDKALTGLREAEPPGYPELARPLIISAEVAFAESRQSLAAGDHVAAYEQATLAVESLHEAQKILTSKNSEFDPAAPIHLVLAEQLALARSFERSSSQTAAATTAADAAARRALAALKAPPKPKPVVPPAATPDAAKTGKPAGPAGQPGPGAQPAPGNRGPQPGKPPQQVRVPPGPPKPPAESE